MQKNQEWKHRVQELFQTAQDEFKRTTEIGRKMLTASKTNSNLHEAYEELGVLAAKEIERGNLEWNNPRVKELLNQIKECEKNLEDIESEVKKIKFASGPMDIGAGSPIQETKSEELSEETSESKAEEKKDDEGKES
jgi:response regulator RpfG family c-di-GMP phosphodiesterase